MSFLTNPCGIIGWVILQYQNEPSCQYPVEALIILLKINEVNEGRQKTIIFFLDVLEYIGLN